jgi:hypothetical protein
MLVKLPMMLGCSADASPQNEQFPNDARTPINMG